MATLLSFFAHKFFRVLLALYLGLFLSIWLISSPVAKHFIIPVLAEHQLQLSNDASIRFNPFLMRITLSDIDLSSTKSKQQESVFALKELTLQVALWQLAFDKIALSKFSLTQGTLKVIKHDDHLVIAGITIPSSTQEEIEITSKQASNQSNQQVLEEAKSETTTSFPYQLVLPDFLLRQFAIELEINNQKTNNKTHHIAIKQLALSQIKATETKQEGNLALTALVDTTQLSFTANAKLLSGKGDINSNLLIKNYPIEKLAQHIEQLTELQGAVSFNSQQTITLAEQGINFRLQKANITLQDLLLGLAEQRFTLQSFQQKFSDVAVNLQDNKITHLAGKSNITLTKALLSQNKSKATIASFKQLNLDDINFVLDDEPSIDITDIVLDDLLFSKKATLADGVAQKAMDRINKLAAEDGLDIAAEAIVKLPPVMQLKQLTLNNLHIHEQSIDINSIIFDTLIGEIIIKENKDIANLIILDDKLNDESSAETIITKEVVAIETELEVKEAELKRDGFVFSFKELSFINESSFAFTDFSVDPIYQRTLFLDTLDVGALSNRKDNKQQKTPYTLVGRSNKYANFNLSGYVQPFSDIATYHLKGDFKEFSLPAISSYLKASTGIEVKTGQLNTALDLTLTDDEVDGNIIVLLQALETALVDSEEAGNLIDQGALPLNMAMGMLKDSDGNVELDVPLSGSISDPNFGLSSIITLITKKAIMSATQDYLMTTFVPYANIVSIAITAGEFALKLRFDDLEYQVKQVEPDAQQSAYLNDFIALMQDKEDTRVTICAISTPADIGLKAGVSVENKSDIKKLLDIGEQREHAFKDHLIEQGKIDSSRILFCKPQIDSDVGAIPRIGISV
jgi:ribosomal protein S7